MTKTHRLKYYLIFIMIVTDATHPKIVITFILFIFL